MAHNEEIETIPAKKKWPLWACGIVFVGIAAVIAHIFCRRGCGKGGSCCGQHKAD